jgi:hypothetical protein
MKKTYTSPDWNLVRGHLALTGSIQYSADVLDISLHSLRHAIKTKQLTYPDDWELRKIVQPTKHKRHQGLINAKNHPSKGIGDEIKKDLVWGMKGADIAIKYDCSVANVDYTRRSLKNIKPLVSTKVGRVSELKKLLSSGKSINQIAIETGTSTNSVRRHKNANRAGHIDATKWTHVPDEYFFVNGSDRRPWKHQKVFQGRIPTNAAVTKRVIAKKLVKRVCAVSGQKIDKRRPWTMLHLCRRNGDMTDNRIENLYWISARHNPHTPPPRGYLFQPWKRINKEYAAGEFDSALCKKYDMSAGALHRAIKEGLVDFISYAGKNYIRLKALPWKQFQKTYNKHGSIQAIMDKHGIGRRTVNNGMKFGLLIAESKSGNLPRRVKYNG